MTDNTILETLKVQPLSEDEKSSRHILKRLVGPIASCDEATRNGRKYNRELWEGALGDDIFQEKVGSKGLLLELGHPADRDEIDLTQVCACIPEMPKIIEGDLYATVEVLDTPNGRLLSNLIDYGFVPGISSRGCGDVMDNDEVDPNTFCLETWDIVNVPALKKARMQVVEGLAQNSTLNLKRALTESLKSSKAEDIEKDEKMMKEAIERLGLDVDTKEDLNEDLKNDQIPEKGDDKLTESKTPEQTPVKKNEANNDGSEDLIKSLSEAIAAKAEVDIKVKNLQEQLAVSDTEVNKLGEEVAHYKNVAARLGQEIETLKAVEAKASTLEEELKVKVQTIEAQGSKIKELEESIATNESNSKSLNESVSSKDGKIAELNESLTKQKEEFESKISSMTESYEKEKSDSINKIKELNESYTKASQLAEGYKKLAHETVNRYIKSKAVMLGITANEITSRLSEKYTLDEVDKVCEDLRAYNSRMSKLPFGLNRKASVKVTESKDPLALRPQNSIDESMDEDIMKLAESFIK